MESIKIQLIKGKNTFDIEYLDQIFSKLGFQSEYIYSEINPKDNFHYQLGLKFLKQNFAFPYLRDCEYYIHHSSEFPFPVSSGFKIVALLNKSYNSVIKRVINISLLEDSYVVLTKSPDQKTVDFPDIFNFQPQIGKVYLVGAGSGQVDMLTLKGLNLIRDADVVFYDNLVGNSILNEVKGDKIFVGKRVGDHSKSQNEINALLCEAAWKHKKIVRLKGGDPSIYGHAAEEITFLESHFIPVEVIPGISSAIAASALSLTPLTVRGIGKSVSFCSGHEKTNIEVPGTDTIVYFMGANNLKSIAKTLKKKNYPDCTPIKLIYKIGSEEEAVFEETMESILTSEINYRSPIIAIVGETTSKKNWWKAFLDKKRILYTGTHIEKYVHLGYVTHHPMIELAPMPDNTEIDQTIQNIVQYDWIIFTSAYAVMFLFNRIYGLGFDSRFLGGIKVVSIGRNTSKHLKNNGIIPDLQPEDESSEGILELMKKKSVVNQHILIPRSDKALPFLPKALEEAGNIVKSLKVYTNVLPKNINKVNPDNYDQVIFASPSGVENFVQLYGRLPIDTELVSKGKETSKALKKHGYYKV